MIRLVACLATVSAASALSPPRRGLARRSGISEAAALDVPRGGAGGFGKFTSLWRETDGIILVYFWSAPYVLAAISPFGLWREFFGRILRSVYVTPKKGEKAYIRWEILWILGSLTNTYILMGEASQPERLRRCALTWAVTFTAAAIKFAAEKQRGWLEDHGYVTAQLVHLGVALSCYAGYFSSK
jgi:hypothetical protein